MNDQLKLISYIFYNNKIVKIVTEVIKPKFDLINIGNNTYVIKEESIYQKSASQVNKKNLFDFSTVDLVNTKTSLNEKGVSYSEDLSIISHFYSTEASALGIEDNVLISRRTTINVAKLTEIRSTLFFGDFDVDYAKYLDTSIEILEKIDDRSESKIDSDSMMYKLKFFHTSKTYFLELKQLSSLLSTGTRKGLNLYKFILICLANGGILYIDEIENNLNKAIIIDIIKLFYSKKTNPYGSVLIFATHYTELLDSIKRNDSIYVFEKGISNDRNTCVNFASALTRNDLKKSEAFISGNLSSSSAPCDQLFRNIQKTIIEYVKQFEPVFGNNNDERL